MRTKNLIFVHQIFGTFNAGHNVKRMADGSARGLGEEPRLPLNGEVRPPICDADELDDGLLAQTGLWLLVAPPAPLGDFAESVCT